MRNIRIILITSLVIAIYIVISLAIKRIDYFKLKEIEVAGNKNFTVQNIIDIAGVKPGVNIFAIDLGQISRNLEALPRIKQAAISRILPDGIKIALKERQPIAILNIPDDVGFRLFEIDEDGRVLAEDNKISDYHLPVITGVEFKNFIVGDNIKIEEILNVARSLSSIKENFYGLYEKISEINISKSDYGNQLPKEFYKNELQKEGKKPLPADVKYYDPFNICFYIVGSQFKVIFGSDITFEKLKKLNSILMQIGDDKSDYKYLDLRFKDIIAG